MRYHIRHQTNYFYNQPVILSPHLLRLRPKSDGGQTLREFTLKINPEPLTITNIIDLDGNSCLQIWFNQPTEELLIDVVSEVETHGVNPFQYLLEPWATCLPFDYPISLHSQLQPYRQFYGLANDPDVAELAQEVMQETEGQVLSFLFNLNDKIYRNCQQVSSYRRTLSTWKHLEKSAGFLSRFGGFIYGCVSLCGISFPFCQWLSRRRFRPRRKTFTRLGRGVFAGGRLERL